MGAKVDPSDMWWTKNTAPNMFDVNSTSELLNKLSEAGDRLVIVDFYAKWWGGLEDCHAVHRLFETSGGGVIL
jgi:hypothetical protein